MAKSRPKFYWKKTCSTCRKAKAFLEQIGAEFDEVDLAKGLTVAELEELIGDRDHRPFLNFRNELYRERGMSKNPPPRGEAIHLMSANPNLIRRPILRRNRKVVTGFDADAMQELLR